MANPVNSTRATPGSSNTFNNMMKNGYQALIACELDPDISFWEREVTPSSIDGGEPIDTTTQHNTTYRTKAPQALRDNGPVSVRVGYDPDVRNQIDAVLNVETSFTIRYPDWTVQNLYGYLQKFEPTGMSNGTMPEATITIIQTNWDPASAVEAGEVVTSTPGTGTGTS